MDSTLRTILVCSSAIIAVLSGQRVIAQTPAQNNAQTPAQATAQPTDTSSQLEEVTVLARRKVENIQVVPVAATVVSNAKLDELTVENSYDMNKLAPGLEMQNSSESRNNFVPSIRGETVGGASGQEPSVVGYFSEVPNFAPSFFDLESIQVLNGPQGTLFGETVLGGAILFQPVKPSNDFNGYVRIQGGGYNYTSFEGAVGGPIVDDVVDFRVSGQMRKRDGYTTVYPEFGALGGPPNPVNPAQADNVDTSDLRLSLVVKPFDGLENYTIFATQYSSNNGAGIIDFYTNPNFINPAVRNLVISANPTAAAQFQLYGGYPAPAGMTWAQLAQTAYQQQLQLGPRAESGDYSRANESRFYGVINHTDFDVTDNLRLRNIFGDYWTLTQGASIDTDASALPLIDTTPATSSLNGRYPWMGGYPDRVWSDEAQVQGKSLNSKLNWQVGYYYRVNAARQWEMPGQVKVFASPSAFPTSAASCAALYDVSGTCSTLTQTSSRQEAIYGQGTYSITPTIHFTAGYREAWDVFHTYTTAGPVVTQTVNGIVLPVPYVVSPTPGAATATSTIPNKGNGTYTLTADWDVTDSVMVYFTNRTGYKTGGANTSLSITDPLYFFGPAKKLDFEAGLKADWTLGGVSGRTNVAVYHDIDTNLQERTLEPGTSNIVTQNIGDAKFDGVEFQELINASRWFEVSGFFNYLNARYTKYLQTATCAADFYYTGCNGLPGTTPVIIDHAHGVLTIGNSVIDFQPDPIDVASKYRVSITPTLKLQPLLKQDIRLTANVMYRSSFATDPAATSELAGVTVPVQTVVGPVLNPLIQPGYTLADFRLDWNNVGDHNYSVSFAVTNAFNKLYRTGTAGGLTIAGVVPMVFGEPRMWYMEVNAKF
jgi:iron complex outermembrane recepter protein